LTELDLSINKLSVFPLSLGKMMRMVRLDVSHNKIGKVDPISKLNKLEYLNLSFNEVIGIPVQVGALNSLRRFLLNDNHLRALPVTVKDLHGLQELNLNNNLLAALPYELGALHITHFSVEHNERLIDPPKDIQAQGAEALLAWMRARIAPKKFNPNLVTAILQLEIWGRNGEIGSLTVNHKTTLRMVRESIDLTVDEAPDRYTFMYENRPISQPAEAREMALDYCVGGSGGTIMLRDDSRNDFTPGVDLTETEDLKQVMLDQLSRMKMRNKFDFDVAEGQSHQIFMMDV